MKHHLFVWGTNPQPFRGKADSSIVLPISVEEMARIGIPARKIPPRAGRIAAPRLQRTPALRDRKWCCSWPGRLRLKFCDVQRALI